MTDRDKKVFRKITEVEMKQYISHLELDRHSRARCGLYGSCIRRSGSRMERNTDYIALTYPGFEIVQSFAHELGTEAFDDWLYAFIGFDTSEGAMMVGGANTGERIKSFASYPSPKEELSVEEIDVSEVREDGSIYLSIEQFIAGTEEKQFHVDKTE